MLNASPPAHVGSDEFRSVGLYNIISGYASQRLCSQITMLHAHAKFSNYIMKPQVHFFLHWCLVVEQSSAIHPAVKNESGL